MYFFGLFPIQSLILFSIAPIIGGVLGIANGRNNMENDKQKGWIFGGLKGIGTGLVIDIPFFCIIMALFSTLP